jgi:hypothetical protein
MATDVDLAELPTGSDAPVSTPSGAAPRSPRWPRWVHRAGVHLGVIAAFTLPAVVLWWNAWRMGAASTVRCACLDPGQQVWFVAWPAYAVAHGLSPFSSTWLWPPHGVNLLDNTSSPLVGVVLSPVTWLFGPFASTTVALTLAPGLSAWGCWVACRRFVTWAPAWWVGGYLFGYSPFVVESVAQGHLSTGLLVVPPLMLAVLHEMTVRQQRSAVWCGVALGLLVFAQLLISAELLTVMAVVVPIGLLAAAAMAPRRALSSLPFAVRSFAVAAVVSLVLAAAPAWDTVAGPQHIRGSVWSSLHDFFTAAAWELWSAGPTRSLLFTGGRQGPQLQFLGYGLLAVAGASVVIAWRRRVVWLMVIVAVVSTVLSWGGILWLSADHPVFSRWLPWQWFTNLSVLDDINAVHFSFLADLAAAIVVAIGLDALHGDRLWRRLPAAGRVVVLAGVAVLLVVPVWGEYGAPLSVQRVWVPQWYGTAGLQVPPGSVVTSYPFPSSAAVNSGPMVWQASDDMRFRLAGGYVKVPGRGRGTLGTGPVGSATWTLDNLTLASAGQLRTLPLSVAQLQNLRWALRGWGTSYIVVTDTAAAATEAAAVFTAATGRIPQVTEGAWVWNLRRDPLRGPYDAKAESAAFGACRALTAELGLVPAGTPLPQALDRCVAAGAHP